MVGWLESEWEMGPVVEFLGLGFMEQDKRFLCLYLDSPVQGRAVIV